MTPNDTPLVLRFLAKLVLDILPAALASIIGGFLFSHYHWGYTVAPAPVGEQHGAASAEMMKLVRDEHTLIVDFLSAEMKAERSRLAAGEKSAEKAPAHAAAAAAVETRAVAAPPRRPVVAMVTPAAKPLTLREPVSVVPQREVAVAVAAPHEPPAAPVLQSASTSGNPMPIADTMAPRPPLAIGQTQPGEGAGPSLITRAINKTAAIKDNIVGATQRAAEVIGGVPSWFGGSADRAAGPAANSSSAGHLVSANW